MSEPKAAVKIRVNITGFMGEAASIYGAYDPNTDMLVIAKDGKAYDGGEREGWLKITNSDRDKAYDALFKHDEEMRDAIMAFFDLESLKLLSLQQPAQRFNPSSRIERIGLDSGGLKFAVHPDATNAQVAILAACLYANRQRGYQSASDMLAEFEAFSVY